MRIPAKKVPPKTGVSQELMEVALKWLRRAYGDKELDSHLIWELQYNLGELERRYCGVDPEWKKTAEKAQAPASASAPPPPLRVEVTHINGRAITHVKD